MVGSHKRVNEAQTTLPHWAIAQYQYVRQQDKHKDKAKGEAKDADKNQGKDKNNAISNFRERLWLRAESLKLPDQKHERWKYTDSQRLVQFKLDDIKVSLDKTITEEGIVSIVQEYRELHPDSYLLVLVNGQYVEHLSDHQKLPASITVTTCEEAFARYERFVEQNQHDEAWALLTMALSTSGLFLQVGKHFKASCPLHLLTLTTQPGIHHASHALILEEGAELVCIQQHIDVTQQNAFTNDVMHVDIQAHAKLAYYCIQNDNKENALHLGYLFVRQAIASEFESYHFALRGQFTRHEIAISLRGDNAKAKTRGFYLLNKENQYKDFHIAIHHDAAHTQSEMFYKGIVKAKARAVFNGKLTVAPHAKKTQAYQANHNLLLHAQGDIYSKPELEIYADDVQCKHGATIGQLNTEALFYLRSRGLSQAEAEQMLSQAFVEEIIGAMPNKTIKQSLHHCVNL